MTPEERGREAFTLLGCVSYHGDDGGEGRGPRLDAKKVTDKLVGNHGESNFSPEVVSQNLKDESVRWLDTVR